MWQDNLVPGGILGLISVWYMFCFLTAVFGRKSQMNVCSKEDWWAGGWWAAGLQTLIWMGCWHSWIPSCRDLANSQRYREEKQKSPDWVGSSAESCKFLPHCTSKEAPTHWPLLWECYTSQFILSPLVQLSVYKANILVMKQKCGNYQWGATIHSLTWLACLMCVFTGQCIKAESDCCFFLFHYQSTCFSELFPSYIIEDYHNFQILDESGRMSWFMSF